MNAIRMLTNKWVLGTGMALLIAGATNVTLAAPPERGGRDGYRGGYGEARPAYATNRDRNRWSDQDRIRMIDRDRVGDRGGFVDRDRVLPRREGFGAGPAVIVAPPPPPVRPPVVPCGGCRPVTPPVIRGSSGLGISVTISF